jgi:hypothetical protein
MSNIAFMSNFLRKDTAACIDVLESTDRVAEAALFALTYKPSAVPSLVQKWKKDFPSIACPEQYSDLFRGYQEGCLTEKKLAEKTSDYANVLSKQERNMDEMSFASMDVETTGTGSIIGEIFEDDEVEM